jgi:hypothetical protein
MSKPGHMSKSNWKHFTSIANNAEFLNRKIILVHVAKDLVEVDES